MFKSNKKDSMIIFYGLFLITLFYNFNTDASSGKRFSIIKHEDPHHLPPAHEINPTATPPETSEEEQKESTGCFSRSVSRCRSCCYRRCNVPYDPDNLASDDRYSPDGFERWTPEKKDAYIEERKKIVADMHQAKIESKSTACSCSTSSFVGGLLCTCFIAAYIVPKAPRYIDAFHAPMAIGFSIAELLEYLYEEWALEAENETRRQIYALNDKYNEDLALPPSDQ